MTVVQNLFQCPLLNQKGGLSCLACISRVDHVVTMHVPPLFLGDGLCGRW